MGLKRGGIPEPAARYVAAFRTTLIVFAAALLMIGFDFGGMREFWWLLLLAVIVFALLDWVEHVNRRAERE